MRRLIVCADDFGSDVRVNEAVEAAHRDGILSTASLMVGAPAAADAIERARRLPGLRVGLHLVLVDGIATSPPGEIPGLVGPDGRFEDNQMRAAVRYFYSPGARRQLATEIRAQFEAFRRRGLTLDHVNAHKHMHVHPTVARLVVEIGREFGMRAVRLPAEPAHVLRGAAPRERHRVPAWQPAVVALRRRLKRSQLAGNDHLFGIAWSGAMTEARVLALLPHLPSGVSELYCHPANESEELAALVSPRVRERIAELGIGLIGYSDLVRDRAAPAG